MDTCALRTPLGAARSAYAGGRRLPSRASALLPGRRTGLRVNAVAEAETDVQKRGEAREGAAE